MISFFRYEDLYLIYVLPILAAQGNMLARQQNLISLFEIIIKTFKMIWQVFISVMANFLCKTGLST